MIMILIRNLIHILLHILAGYLIAQSDIINSICYGCNLYKNDMQNLVYKMRWQGNPFIYKTKRYIVNEKQN